MLSGTLSIRSYGCSQLWEGLVCCFESWWCQLFAHNRLFGGPVWRSCFCRCIRKWLQNPAITSIFHKARIKWSFHQGRPSAPYRGKREWVDSCLIRSSCCLLGKIWCPGSLRLPPWSKSSNSGTSSEVSVYHEWSFIFWWTFRLLIGEWTFEMEVHSRLALHCSNCYCYRPYDLLHWW